LIRKVSVESCGVCDAPAGAAVPAPASTETMAAAKVITMRRM
jgi:hypothetical protein